MIRCLFAAALLAAVVAAPPQSEERSIGNADRLVAEGKLLAALVATDRELEVRPRDPRALDRLAYVRSFVGDTLGALEAMERMAGRRGSAPSAELAARLEGCTPIDALDEIVRRAATQRVVIINEAHHVPQHRAFSQELAARLRPLGFHYLACETFSGDATALAARGYPLLESGFYSREPVFGDFIRSALKLGYQPIHYEIERSGAPTGDVTDSINEREIAQCENLMARLFAADPGAKALIHVGYSHATENWEKQADGRELAWMAARLARRLGIDPLTIDQTEQMAASQPDRGSAARHFAQRRGWLDRAVCLRDRSGAFVVDGDGFAGRVDLQIFHPAVTLVDGRPDWLHRSGGRKPAEIPAELEPSAGRRLIEAWRASEREGAVPVDRIVVEAGEPCPVLLLPPGHYRVAAQDESGMECGRADLEQQ